MEKLINTKEFSQEKLTNIFSEANRFQKNLDELSEQQLWEKFLAGQEDTFIYIYDKWFETLFTYGCQFTKNRELVKDCIQELFIYLKEKKANTNKNHPVKSIKFYLLACLRNRLIKALGNESKWSFFRTYQLPESAFGFETSHELQLIARQLDEHQLSQLLQALNNLTPKQREAVTYYFYDGMSYLEIANTMSLKDVKYARKLIYRALESLRDFF